MLRWFSTLSLIFGTVLLGINIYGMGKSLRPEGLVPEVMRFAQEDLTLSQHEFFASSKKTDDETNEEYALRLTSVIANGMAHVHWERYNPSTFNQKVPIWENYILFLMGTFSGIPEFERYHFTIPEKSIERGVGLCGDASMLLSELLIREGISNKIVTVPGHVMVETSIGGKETLLDPDFGVVLRHDVTTYLSSPEQLELEYNLSGFIGNGEKVVSKGMRTGEVEYWNGSRHFVTKKYYFERVSYLLKWLIPIALLLTPVVLRRKDKNQLSK